MNKIRAERGLSYTEATKRMERNSERVTVLKEQEHGAGQNICMDEKPFLAFIAMVLNIQGKAERIKMVPDAARRFLNVVDISGEDVDITLRKGFAIGSGL